MKIFGSYLWIRNFAFAFLIWSLCFLLASYKPVHALILLNNYNFNGDATGWDNVNGNGYNVCGNNGTTGETSMATLGYNGSLSGQTAYQAITPTGRNISARAIAWQEITIAGSGSVKLNGSFSYYANSTNWNTTTNSSWIRMDIEDLSYNHVATLGCVSFNSNQAWTTTSTSSDITLTGGTTYYLVVTMKGRTRAVNSAPAVTLGIDNIILNHAPVGLGASSVADTTNVSLTWTASTGGTGSPALHGSTPYKVYRKTSAGVTTADFLANATTNSYTDTSSTGNTTYYYAVTNVDTNSLISPLSAEVSQLTRPGAPTSLNFTSVTSTSMRVNWTAPAGGATSYKVERCTGTGCSSYTEIATGVTNTYYDNSSLDASTVYRYRIRATNATGDGPYSTAAEQSTSSPGVSGTIYADEIGTVYNCANNNLTIAVRVDGSGSGSGTCNASTGAYSVSATYTSSSTVHIYIDGENVVGSTIIMPTSADSVTGVAIYLNRVNLPTPAQSTVTNTLLDYYDNTQDSDMNFSVTSGVLTVEDGSKLVINTGQTFDPNGNVIAPAIEVKGTFTPEANTVELNAAGTSTTCTDPAGLVMPLCINGGTFTYGTSTVKYTGTTTSTTQTFWQGGSGDDGANKQYDSNYYDFGEMPDWNTSGILQIGGAAYNNSIFEWEYFFTGIRFRSITIPKNASITSAQFDIKVPSGTFPFSGTGQIYGTNADNISEFSASNLPSNNAYGSYITWTYGTNTPGSDAWASSIANTVPPSVTSLVQAMVNRSGWVSGNAMGIIISTDNNSLGSMRPYLYGADSVAKLTVTTSSSAVTLAGTSYYNLEVGTTQDSVAGTTYTLGGNTNVYNLLTVGNALSTNTDTLAGSSYTLTIEALNQSSPFTLTSKGAFSAGTSTVIFKNLTDAGDMYFPGGTYYNLELRGNVSTNEFTYYATYQNYSVTNNFVMSDTYFPGPDTTSSAYVWHEESPTATINNFTTCYWCEFHAPPLTTITNDVTNDGTFYPGSGQVVFDASDDAGTIGGSNTFNVYDVEFFDDGVGKVYTLDTILSVAHDLEINLATLDVGVGNESIYVGGSWLNTSGIFVERSGTVTFNGTGAGRTIDSGCSDVSTCTNQEFKNVTINFTNSTDTISLADNFRFSQTLQLTSGKFIQGNYNVRTGTNYPSINVASSGTYSNTSTGDIVFGGLFANAGNVILKGNNTCGGNDDIVITAVSGTPYWNGAGTYDISDVSIANQEAGVAITAISSTNAGGNIGSWTFQSSCGAGSLTSDIVDSGGTPVGSPNVNMSSIPFSVTHEISTATFGVSAERIRVHNTTGNPQWSLSVAATDGPTALWNVTTYYYDFNDTTANAGDGGDTDTYGGRMTINPASATLSPQSGCNNTGLTLGTSSGFAEGTTNSITLVTAGASAGTNCYWDLTNIDISQTIPAEQTQGSYTIDMTVSVVAI